MTCLLGIDLGTSSVKAVVVDEHGGLAARAAEEYPILTPRPGWAEQDPGDWWAATVRAVRKATADCRGSICGIGIAGQMHGTVLIDPRGKPVRNAVIWADGRSVDQAGELLGGAFARITGTAPAAGFMGPTLLWLMRHEPQVFESAGAALLPKDYLRLLLTGEIASEATDASSTALFDIRKRRWSSEIIEAAGLKRSLFPQILEPADLAGKLLQAAACELNLPAGIPVVAGCADQAAQAVGNGLFDPGQGSVTIGSGGQIFIPLDSPVMDPDLRTHTFCHAPADRWYMLGATLCAGLSLRWLRDAFGLRGEEGAFAELSALASQAPPGSGGLFFLPYLAGERSPLMDPHARGCFIGLDLKHDRRHMARSVMEGVAFALRHVMETVESMGVHPARLLASGSGLADPFWRQVAADILKKPLSTDEGKAQTGIGAALLAGIGLGVFSGYEELKRIIGAKPAKEAEAADADSGSHRRQTRPQASLTGFYDSCYEQYLLMYPRLRPVFHALQKVSG